MTKSVRQAAREIQLDLRRPVAGPDLGGLIAELRQLEEEFGGLDVDFRCKTVRVTTEPITLEGVYLGPFCLKLRWDRLPRLADSSCFQIEALEPNPASSNEAVTHPHVHSGSLCAGEATTPIRRALENGRIADAFCLIRSVLTNYNSSSPHVSLEHWDGGDCHDCGCAADTASQANGTGNGGENVPRTPPRLATQSQVKAIFAIAKSGKLDLKRILQDRFKVAKPEDLGIKEASALIDELKKSSQQNGG